jgi:hypothetical protein
MSLTSPALRRVLRALPLTAALAAVALPVASASAATGPKVGFQLNDLNGIVDLATVTLGAATDAPIAGPDMPYSQTCPGLAADEYPADSVAALLHARDANWTLAPPSSGFDWELTMFGSTHAASSLGFNTEVPGWHMWINDTYYNFGQDTPGGLCHELTAGDRVVLQGTERHFPDGGGMYGLPTTPQLRVTAPPTVAAGATFTATVTELTPPDSSNGWGGNAVQGTPSVSAGYGVGFDGDSAPFAATDAQGHATVTAPAGSGGILQLVGIAGTDPAALPTADHNSAYSPLADICVYDNRVNSPCTATLSAQSTDFGTQARGSLGAATPVVVTPALGTATISGAKVVSGDADDFMVSSDGCTGTTVNSGTGAATPNCAVRVRFAPSVAGARSAVLRITSNASNTTLDVPLTGTGGAATGGPQGPAGADGAKGDTGDRGATGATGATGANGANGSNGAAGATGATGPQGKAGKNGRDAVCTVKRTKGAPKVTCKLVSSSTKSTKATLTRAGKVYAKGTVASLRGTRKVPAGVYTLRYRTRAGKAVALRVRIG